MGASVARAVLRSEVTVDIKTPIQNMLQLYLRNKKPLDEITEADSTVGLQDDHQSAYQELVNVVVQIHHPVGYRRIDEWYYNKLGQLK